MASNVRIKLGGQSQGASGIVAGFAESIYPEKKEPGYDVRCVNKQFGHIWMRAAMTQLNLSVRAYHRILKLARTIADLAGE